jgi:8-oxo-dGTP pyrophosphatase MutT (NUDIX family)
VDRPSPLIVLIATQGGKRWQLPKGTVEPGETPVQTAIREVVEETGLYTVHEAFLKTISYSYQDTFRKSIPELVQKQVDFFLLRVVGGRLNDASYEVDKVAWYTPSQALKRLAFAGEREVVTLAMEYL